jgi:hypothetical protein
MRRLKRFFWVCGRMSFERLFWELTGRKFEEVKVGES